MGEYIGKETTNGRGFSTKDSRFLLGLKIGFFFFGEVQRCMDGSLRGIRSFLGKKLGQ